jgi:flagellar motor switch protein FliN/FliY
MATTSKAENTGSSGTAASGASPLPHQIDEMIGDLASSSGVSVKTADFAELDAQAPTGNAAALDNLLDVTVTVTAELGRATTSIGHLLKLNVGSVVELERLISDPVDLMAQGVRLARGEVVVVEDRFAIRIQEIVDPRKRM